MKIFLDTNVVLDVLAERTPWFDDSAAVLSLLESTETEGFIAAHSVTTLYYLIEKHVGGKRARGAIVDLLKLVAVAPVDQAILLKALSLGWSDFEDAVQGACAVEIGTETFITRNAADFNSLTIPVRSPTEFLSSMQAAAEETGAGEGAAQRPVRRPRRRRT